MKKIIFSNKRSLLNICKMHITFCNFEANHYSKSYLKIEISLSLFFFLITPSLNFICRTIAPLASTEMMPLFKYLISIMLTNLMVIKLLSVCQMTCVEKTNEQKSERQKNKNKLEIFILSETSLV